MAYAVILGMCYRHEASFLKVRGEGQIHPKNLDRQKKTENFFKIMKIIIWGGVGVGMGVA